MKDTKKFTQIIINDEYHVDLLEQTLELYQTLNTYKLPHIIRYREERMRIFENLMHSIEDWMSLCLGIDFVEQMKIPENIDKEASTFVGEHLSNRMNMEEPDSIVTCIQFTPVYHIDKDGNMTLHLEKTEIEEE